MFFHYNKSSIVNVLLIKMFVFFNFMFWKYL